MSEIIILGPAYPLRGGIANFNEALCKAITGSGRRCTIVSFTLQYPAILFPGKTQHAEGDPAPEGVEIIPLVNSVNPLSWRKAAAYIRKQNPGILIVRYWMPFMAPSLGTIIRWVKKGNPQIRVVAIADNIIPHEQRPGDSVLTRYFVRSCDEFIVMSKSVLQDLKKFDSHKPVKLLPHPIYDMFGSPVPKETARVNLGLGNEKLVLFFGFVRHYKGLDLLIRAMADSRIKNSAIKLLAAGEFYEDKSPYVQLVKDLGLQDSVIFHDHYIPKEQVKNYFCASDLVVQPYRDATQSGITQIAYHFGKPMVVTNVGGLPEIVQHGKAGYVTEVSPESIAMAIDDFFSTNKAGAMEKGVKEVASLLSWETFAREILE